MTEQIENIEREIGKQAKALGASLIEINLSDIELISRSRQDLGNLDELALSLSERGQLQNLVVMSNNGDAEKPYRLLAGGRRYTAMTEKLGWKRAFALCFPTEITELELLEIELEENSKRKDLSWKEETALKKKIYDLSVEKHGKKVGTFHDATGVSMSSVAKKMETSAPTLSRDIKLASLVEKCPEVFDKCKNKAEAQKLVSLAEEQMARAELAKRVSAGGEQKIKSLIDSYIIGDFLNEVKKIDNEVIDFCEVDPPYSIDLKGTKMTDTPQLDTRLQAYNEIKEDDYLTFIGLTLTECYRVMTPNSWLILWFAPEPWFEPIYHLINGVGFETTRLTGKWVKPTGQCQHPDKYLANASEEFFYCRKGDPVIARQGRTNVFPYLPVPHQKKIHPTERPIELIEDILTTFCWEGSKILVPFLGSGKTILAAHKSNMNAFGYDRASEYKDGYILSVNELFGRK